MATDASILLGLKPMQTTSPMAMYEAGEKIETNRLANMMNTAKLDEYQRGVTEQNSLRDVYKTFGTDAAANTNKLYGAGLGKQAGEYAKAAGDLAKDRSTTNKTDIETQQKVNGMLGSAAKALLDSPTLNMQEIAGTVERLKSQLPTQYHSILDVSKLPQDPQGMRTALQGLYTQSIETDKLLTDATSKRNNDQNNFTSASNNAATVGATYAGQRQSDQHFQAGQNAPQYMETDQGLVALPKKLANGQQPTASPVMGADGQPLGKPLKQIPVSANSAIIQNTQSLNALDRALSLIGGENVGSMKGDKEATGLKGYLPNGLLNRIDPQGVDARAELSDIGSLKIHDRSGAAVTLSEAPRLMPFIPLATDDALTAKKKLTRLRMEIVNEAKALSDTYSKDNGYKPSGVKPTAQSDATLVKPDALGMEAEMRKRGLLK